MQKNSIVVSLLLSISACATPTITEIHLKPEFIEESSQAKAFEPISVYQFNNSEQWPWLYELSGLAWDYDEQVLYSVTDGGYLVILKPYFTEQKIEKLELLEHHSLKDKQGHSLKGKFSDSEGLALRNHRNGKIGDTELIVSFEREPRVDAYTNKGNFINRIVDFKSSFNNFTFASSNKQLESVTEWDEQNYLFGSERPLEQSHPGEIQLFDRRKPNGLFKLHDEQYGALVGLTTLPDQSFIALERVFVNVFTTLQFHIHQLEHTKKGFKQTTLHSSAEEYEHLYYIYDNFEGITHHKDEYFFMVSDDNQNAMQRTLLIYFRLKNLNYYHSIKRGINSTKLQGLER